MNASSKQSLSVSKAENVISIKASLVATIAKEKPGLYVSYCPALDLYSQGKTERDAEKKIIEATELFIGSCLERGVLNEVLKECGFHTMQQRPHHNKPKKTQAMVGKPSWEINIPAELPVMAYG